MRYIFEHVLLKLELLIVTIENVVNAGGVPKLTESVVLVCAFVEKKSKVDLKKAFRQTFRRETSS